MRIAWAFESSGLSTKQLRMMDNLIHKFQDEKTEPDIVHVEAVLLAGGIDPFGSYSPLINIRNARGDVLKALKRANINISPEHLHLVNSSVSSVTSSVENVLNAAVQNKNDTMALFTKANTGIERWILGSFAETMVHRSKMDLLLMNPKTKWSGNIDRILFLDDFSPESKKHLEKTMELCKEQKAELIVLHIPQLNYSWSFEKNNPIVARYRKRVDHRVSQIENQLRRARVAGEVILGSVHKPIYESAFEIVKQMKIDLISIVAKTGVLGSLLGGSVTRHIMRTSTIPVLVQKTGPRLRIAVSKSRTKTKFPLSDRPQVFSMNP